MRTLITGGGGFIGSAVARVLVERAREGDEIILVDDLCRHGLSQGLRALLEARAVRLLERDLLREDALDALPGPVDRVYHFAGIVGVDRVERSPFEALAVNARITLNTFEWFRRRAAPGARLLFASSSEVYAGSGEAQLGFPVPTPESVPVVFQLPYAARQSYAVSKLLGEVLASAAAARGEALIVSVRYHNVYGPEMGDAHVIPQIIARIGRRQTPFEIFGAEQTRSFCWIEDAARATCAVLEAEGIAGGAVVHIGDPCGEITVAKLYEMLFSLCDFRPGTILQRPAAPGSAARRCPDTRFLEAQIGRMALLPLEDGLRRTVAFYRGAHANRA